MKTKFIKLLSMATYPGMDDSKKLALQVATFDGLWTLLTIFFYAIYTFYNGLSPLYYFHSAGLILVGMGLWLMRKRHFDSGRFLIHLTGLAEIFISADAVGEHAGYEFYYFTSITVPFVTFSIEERQKGFILSAIACVVLVTQEILGHGIFLPTVALSQFDMFVSMFVVVMFIVAVMSVARWQMNLTQDEIRRQKSELIHSSNLIALGEMSGGIAHEINNPLQTLLLHNESIRRFLRKNEMLPEKIGNQLDTVDKTVTKISAMIRGLKELSRDVSQDPDQVFLVGKVIDDVMSISSERIKNLGVRMVVNNQSVKEVKGKPVHVAQALLNLLNNSVDALELESEKIIHLNVKDSNNFVIISVVDSGQGISRTIQHKIMQPFFTTKEPGKGTGLGLSISRTIIEKSGGKFYFDPLSKETRFVIELPVA